MQARLFTLLVALLSLFLPASSVSAAESEPAYFALGVDCTASQGDSLRFPTVFRADSTCGRNAFSVRTRLVALVIGYRLDKAARRLTIVVLDESGRTVKLVRAAPAAGPDSLAWDGRDDAGRHVAVGEYRVRFTAPFGSVEIPFCARPLPSGPGFYRSPRDSPIELPPGPSRPTGTGL
jgi:hypothetical protein